MDVAAGKSHAALARVQRAAQAVPQSATLQQLLGRVHETRRERDQAEAAYLRAIELDPRLLGGYLDLARFYAAAGRVDQALARATEAVRLNPRNVSTLMTVGMLHERSGDLAKAKDAYQRALDVNPRFAPAANNLAYLYSEHGGDQERAFQLAQTAREGLPTDPHIADTLGWILYKRGIHQRALSLLQESAAKLTDNAEVQYHLGMAAAKTGDRELARRALTQALASPATGPWKDAARQALSTLE
jgi:Flp pilus assembly protein TadD